MGDVYRAEDTMLRRQVAIKRVARSLRCDRAARFHILREAQRVSALNSEYIASLYDVIEQSDEIFLVMEYVEGQTLRERSREGFQPEQFMAIATQCIEGLATAHDAGILHCDIKPENLMLTSSEHVKILDFGLARQVPRTDQSSTLESTGLLAGTPAYMAPEILQGKIPDARSDVYSLGIVFYEALVGHHPFKAGSFIATAERILHERPAPISTFNRKIPGDLEAVVHKMMARDPAKRYQSTRVLLGDFRRLERSGMSESPPLIVSERFDRNRVSRRVRASATVLVLCVAAALGIYRWSHVNAVVAAPSSVLISDFENSSDQTVPEKAVREALTIALQQSHYVNVLPRSRAYEALERMKRPDVTRIDEILGREICRRENVKVLLAGSIARLDDTFHISVWATDPVQGGVLFAEQAQIKGTGEFFARVDLLSHRVRERLGESMSSIESNSQPLAKVSTSSLDALQLYSQALDSMARGMSGEAISFLQSALQLDPNFAMAHLRLGECYSSVIGKNERAVTEFERAYDLRQSVTERERLWIEGQYANILESDELSAQAFASLVGLYPDDADAHQQLASAYDNLGRLSAAIAEQRRALELTPNSVPGFSRVIRWLARDNQNDEAIRIFDAASRRGIDSPYLRWGVGLAYLGRDQILEAREQFRLMSQGSPPEREIGQIYFAVTDLYEGKLTTAQEKLAENLSARGQSRKDLSLVRRDLLALTRLLLGDPHGAQHQAELILVTPPSDLQTVDFRSAGTVFARAGNTKRARQVLHKLDTIRKKVPTTWNNSSYNYLEGEVALAEGRPAEALTAFRTAATQYPDPDYHLGLAYAYIAMQQWAQASQELEEFLQQRGYILQLGFPPDLALGHLELGRVYRRLGNMSRAYTQYQQFLAMWRQADDLPSRRLAARELQQLGRHN